MTHVLVFLAAMAALAAVLIFAADRPGVVSVALEHWHVQTSVTVAIAGLIVLAAISVGLWIILRNVWLAPVQATAEARERKKAEGLSALSRGLVAIGAGDLRAARN